jgi:hypothetical protein
MKNIIKISGNILRDGRIDRQADSRKKNREEKRKCADESIKLLLLAFTANVAYPLQLLFCQEEPLVEGYVMYQR